MRIFLLFFIFFLPLVAKEKPTIFHKTVGQLEAYKDSNSLYLPIGCVRRLTKNLLTPIHKRKHKIHNTSQQQLLKKTTSGPLTIKFLLPLSLKKEILSLLSRQKIALSIPLTEKESIISSHIEMDRYAKPPKGLFAMKSIIKSPLLSPSEVVFIHLLKGDISQKSP